MYKAEVLIRKMADDLVEFVREDIAPIIGRKAQFAAFVRDLERNPSYGAALKTFNLMD